MNDLDVFDLESEDVSQVAWEAAVYDIYDNDAFDSCGGWCGSGCERTDCIHE